MERDIPRDERRRQEEHSSRVLDQGVNYLLSVRKRVWKVTQLTEGDIACDRDCGWCASFFQSSGGCLVNNPEMWRCQYRPHTKQMRKQPRTQCSRLGTLHRESMRLARFQ